MEDYKIDYVERIKTLLQKEDIDGLQKFLVKIKKNIEGDQEFNEVLDEIQKKNYPMALAIAEEILYENNDDPFSYGDDEEDEGDDEGGYGGGYGSTGEDTFEEDVQY